MFTGLIQEIGQLASAKALGEGMELRITSSKLMAKLAPGGSISCNGVCLSAEAVGTDYFTCFAVKETVERTNFSHLMEGDLVNLELPPTPADFMGGHLVTGHIDSVAKVLSNLELEDESSILTIEIPPAFQAHCMEKGSIAINGVSLTVAKLERGMLSCALIPLTRRETNLSQLEMGDMVNIEVDAISKMVARAVQSYLDSRGFVEKNPADA